jgi:hypothetical protein
VRDTISAAAAQSGRAPEDVRLIAVSKTLPPEYIRAALQAGQYDFGENTVQEALGKIPHFPPDLIWHFIGHLQSNKARLIPGHFHWLHSLDSSALAQRLSRKAQETGASLNVLIEVNIARDPAKHGILPEALLPLMDELMRTPLPGLSLRGLMAIGPHPADEHTLRAAFAVLRGLRDDCAQRCGLAGFTELSMGMSGDYVEAIREGSTMVRIGAAIFGERDYPVRP